LFIAAKKGHIQVAKLLLSRGADVTHQTKVRLSLLGTQVTLLWIVLLAICTVTYKYSFDKN